MREKNWRLLGSSLIEVLSGLSLLSLVLGLGLGLFQQLSGPLSAREWARAQAICINISQQSPRLEELYQGIQHIEIHHFEVSRQVLWHDEAKNLCAIKVSCSWQEHLMAENVRLSRIKQKK